MKFSSALYALAVAGSLSQAAAVEKRDLASDIWSDIESATTCAACEVSKTSFRCVGKAVLCPRAFVLSFFRLKFLSSQVSFVSSFFRLKFLSSQVSFVQVSFLFPPMHNLKTPY
jgi:hypothetical protein